MNGDLTYERVREAAREFGFKHKAAALRSVLDEMGVPNVASLPGDRWQELLDKLAAEDKRRARHER